MAGEDVREEAGMSTKVRAGLSVGLFAAILTAALYLARWGAYGWTLFIMLPVIAGALGTWSFRPETAGRAARIGALTGVAGCGLFLVLGVEGLICVVMALPLVVPLAIAGSLLAYWGGPWSNAKAPVAMGLLLPVSLLFDAHAKPPVFAVTTSIEV